MSGRKRARNSPPAADSSDSGFERMIKDLDRGGALRMLDDLCEKWQLGPDGVAASFADQTTQMFRILGMDPEGNMSEELGRDLGSYGLREITETIRRSEVEAIGLFHRMRELDLFPAKDASPDDADRVNLRRVTKVMETIYYAKRVVLSAFQAKLAVRQLHIAEEGALDLDPDLDTRLGAWMLRFRYIEGNTTPLQQLLLYLLDVAMEKKYRKASGYMWEPVLQNGVDTHAWVPVCDTKEFVHRALPKETQWEQWVNATSNPKNIPAAVEYLESCRDHQLPPLVKQRGVYSFRNGVYLAREDRFHAFDAQPEPLPDSVVACKFFDDDFVPYDRWEDIPTPCLDSIADHQEWPAEVRQWMYVLLGRMLYAVNELDGWQVVPFFMGKAGTGKSTLLLKVCKIFFEAVDVGILSNNIERKFGISAFHDKYLVLAPEIRNDLAIEQGEFQSMVSGEDVQINAKHKTAFSTVWRVPMALAGNEVPDWADAAGSIQRRNVVFAFRKTVRNGDMKLGEKLEAELPAILQKCNKAYLEQAAANGAKNIWSVLPKYFLDTRDDLARRTNPIEAFLADESVVQHGEDRFCSLEDFRVALQTYLKAHGLSVRNVTDNALADPLEKWECRISGTETREHRGQRKKSKWVVGCEITFDADNTLG